MSLSQPMASILARSSGVNSRSKCLRSHSRGMSLVRSICPVTPEIGGECSVEFIEMRFVLHQRHSGQVIELIHRRTNQVLLDGFEQAEVFGMVTGNRAERKAKKKSMSI